MELSEYESILKAVAERMLADGSPVDSALGGMMLEAAMADPELVLPRMAYGVEWPTDTDEEAIVNVQALTAETLLNDSR